MELSKPKNSLRDAPREYMRERHTFGIALCRIHNDKYEIAAVCKRYSYSLNLLVQGRYNSDDMDTVKLLSGLYNEEKPIVMSLNFAHIWAKKYLNNEISIKYAALKRKFDLTFNADGGARLRRLMRLAGRCDHIYELPKGSKLHKKESNLMCAVREFEEETGISKQKYNLFPGETRQYIFISDGVKYINTYFLAFTTMDSDLAVDFSNQDQYEEIVDIKFMSIEEIRLIDTGRRLENFVRPIFNFVRNYVNM